MQERYVKVRLLDAPFFLDKEYDYSVPPSLSPHLEKGSFVTVPFGGGNRPRMAVVTGEGEGSPDKALKPVRSLSTPRISLDEEMLGLVCFLREHALATTGDAVHAMIPSGALSSLSERFFPTDKALGDVRRLSPEEAALLAYLREAGNATAQALRARFGDKADEMTAHLCRLGFAVRELLEKSSMAQKESATFALAVPRERAEALIAGKEKKKLGEKQRLLLSLLLRGEQKDEALKKEGITRAQINAFLKNGWLSERRETVLRSPIAVDAYAPKPLPQLTDEQKAVFEKIETLAADGAAHAVLLHGVTGSGKTAVMLQEIDRMLARGRGVIVLLPEIALTPQTLEVFCSRFGDRVAVLHSGLSAGERTDTYFRILSGDADVVIGTRSAVFAPVKNLGLIVIDEEHESTYKSDMNPKYHARDVARYRAAYHKAVLLLSSATPSLESYKRAKEGRYTLLELKKRYEGAVLPAVEIADMRAEAGAGNLSPLGEKLTARLAENLKAGDQAILFLNRRGYHHTISCRSCGKPLTCPACSVSLTYHTKKGTYKEGYLLCHICGRRAPMPTVCPSCGSPHLARLGYGTQRVEEELSSLFPASRVLRMDTDTTASRYAYDELLGAFRRREADILLGTQMVTKGHDFPDVTLVGVLMADASLYLDDYRAGERTFSMLTQVIGRAGRAAKKGVAVIQTANPDHDVITLAAKQDYAAFYEREIRLRKLLAFPPFCDIALLTLSDKNEQKLLRGAKVLADELSARISGAWQDVKLIAFGPFEAPVYRAEGEYRMRMVVKCVLNTRSRALFADLLSAFSKESKNTPILSVDLNPSNL